MALPGFQIHPCGASLRLGCRRLGLEARRVSAARLPPASLPGDLPALLPAAGRQSPSWPAAGTETVAPRPGQETKVIPN